MKLRQSLVGAVVAALAGTTVALSAAPAHAAVDPDDTTFTPVAADLIGVGSDTSQHALKLLAEAYNGGTPAPGAKVATFAATGGGDIALPTASIPRPNGSGAGKALLFGAGNNTDIDFARSSSAISTAEAQAGLQAFPFALDTLQMAVSATTPSNAPTSLTPAQIVDIYQGDVTNWNAIGGTAGTIVPMIPQAGSGTRSFFVAQLKAMNGGVDVVLGASVQEVQEHDDTPIKNNANAIAPFSVGRAGLLGTTLRLVNGFKADRALYNVVRGTDLAKPEVQAVFGEAGFVCSNEARDLIEAAGFKQLARPADNGVCGAPTQSATTNFTLNEAQDPIATTTTLTVLSSGRNVRLQAAVTASESAQGTVAFFEGETQLATGRPLISGQATFDMTGVVPGAHTYRAVFTPEAGTPFEASQDDASANIKASSSVKESFPAQVKKGKLAKGTVTVTINGGGTATGKVVIKEGNKTLASPTLKGGKATVTLPALKKGKHTLKVSWAGNGLVAGSSKTFTITQK